MRALSLIVPTIVIACAQAVSQDFVDDEGGGATAPMGTSGADGGGGKVSGSGGKTGSTGSAGKAGTGTQAFGGSATSGGNSNEGGEDSGGTGGSTSAGSGGKASGGTGGLMSGGSSGSGGAGGSGGTGTVGSGSCSDTPLFVVGAGTKYAKDAKVVAVCSVGTPCTQAQPPLQNGKQYEFKCLDEYNCGTQNPGTTNWAQPPWAVTKACDE